MNPVLFSSAKQDWTTPRWLFAQLDAEFGFEIDAAASAENALCDRFFTEEDDALQQDWRGRTFSNPPYDRVAKFVEYGWRECYERGNADLVVFVVASRTGTQWWQKFANHGAEIRFIEGRLRFGGSTNSAPFDSAVLVFDRFKTHPVAFSTIKQPKGRQEA